MITPHISERYRCQDCKKEFVLFDVNRFWLCPQCHKPIYIKYEINDFQYSAQRLKPECVIVGQSIILSGGYLHEILNIMQTGDIFKIALAEYGVINTNKDDYLFVIQGGWAE